MYVQVFPPATFAPNRFQPGPRPFAGFDDSAWLAPAVAVGVIGVFGLIVYAVVRHTETLHDIATTQGVDQALKYELGTTAISLGAEAVSSMFTSNRRRNRRRRAR